MVETHDSPSNLNTFMTGAQVSNGAKRVLSRGLPSTKSRWMQVPLNLEVGEPIEHRVTRAGR